MSELLNAVTHLKQICNDHTDTNKDCVGCVFYRKVGYGGNGCAAQTAPGHYDIEDIKKHSK